MGKALTARDVSPFSEPTVPEVSIVPFFEGDTSEAGPFRSVYNTWRRVLDDTHTELPSGSAFIVQFKPSGPSAHDRADARRAAFDLYRQCVHAVEGYAIDLVQAADGGASLCFVPVASQKELAVHHLRRLWRRLWP